MFSCPATASCSSSSSRVSTFIQSRSVASSSKSTSPKIISSLARQSSPILSSPYLPGRSFRFSNKRVDGVYSTFLTTHSSFHFHISRLQRRHFALLAKKTVPKKTYLAGVLKKLDGTGDYWKNFNMNFVMASVFFNIGLVLVVTFYRQLRHHEKNVADLERHESAKLQLDSPEFRCFYTASQYRAAKCLELTLATTTEGTLYTERWGDGYRMSDDMPFQRMVAEQDRRKERLERQRKLEEQMERSRM